MRRRGGFAGRREGDWFLRVTAAQVVAAVLTALFCLLVCRFSPSGAAGIREKTERWMQRDYSVAELAESFEQVLRGWFAEDA